MAVNIFPAPTVAQAEQRVPIVFSSVTATTSTTTINNSQQQFVPKGSYTVHAISNAYGTTAGGGVTYGVSAPTQIRFTLTSIEADTGRPGPVFNVNNANNISNVVFPKDVYTSITLTGTNGTRWDIILTPTVNQFTSYPVITANTSTTATSSTTSSIGLSVHSIFLGWDYDNNSPCILVGRSGVSTINTEWRSLSNSFLIWRYNPSTEQWSYKSIQSLSAGSGTFPSGSNLFTRISSGTATSYGTSVFIKNNFLHNLTTTEIYRDSSGNAWGWMKGDLTTSGTTLTMEPGHTNAAFTIAQSSLATGVSRNMMYYWDRRFHKVVFTGGRAVSTGQWISRWAQWDIQTDTVDYQNINGSFTAAFGGGSGNNNLVYTCGVPDVETGFIYALGDGSAGATQFLAKWDRSGNRTDVGAITLHPTFSSVTQGGAQLTSSSPINSIDYLPYGITIVKNNNLLIDKTGTTSTVKGFLSASALVNTANIFTGLGGDNGTSNGKFVLVMSDGIYILQASMLQYGDYLTVPVQVLKLPMTKENLNSILPRTGALTATDAAPAGTNPGNGN